MTSVNHQIIDAENVAERYVTGRLSPGEAARFEEHYLDCPACCTRVEAAERMEAEGGVVVATPAERVISANTAREVRSMLEGAVSAERATGKAASVPGVRVGGKTGTTDDPECDACAHSPGTFASFVGIVPIDRPRWVIYVGVGEPSQPGSGGTIAAPAFARIAARGLALEPAL